MVLRMGGESKWLGDEALILRGDVYIHGELWVLKGLRWSRTSRYGSQRL